MARRNDARRDRRAAPAGEAHRGRGPRREHLAAGLGRRGISPAGRLHDRARPSAGRHRAGRARGARSRGGGARRAGGHRQRLPALRRDSVARGPVCGRPPPARLATGRHSPRRVRAPHRGGRHSRGAGSLPGGRSPPTPGTLMRAIPLALALSLAVPASSLAAQATRDQSRLVFNVGLGYAGGTDLWEVTGQRLTDDSSLPVRTDFMNMQRDVGPTLTFGVKGIYFRGDNFGLLGEAYFLGLGLRDACTLTTSSGSGRNAEVCARINGAERSASAVQVATGVIY